MEYFKLLIVDDSVDNLKIMVALLEENLPNCEVFQTSKPENALNIACQTQPDLIITDWDMPAMSGIELIRSFKAEEAFKNTPVIMATGVMLTPENLRLAFEVGAMDYVRKPIDPIELNARIHSALLITRLHKENLRRKDEELASKALLLVKNNEFNIETKRKLTNFADSARLKGIDLQLFEDIIVEIDEKIQANSWQRFDLAFEEVHPNFKKNLLLKFTKLTPADIKLCTFIRMGMSIKDISSVLYHSPDGIKVARSRLRKKLQLKQMDNLQCFLAHF